MLDLKACSEAAVAEVLICMCGHGLCGVSVSFINPCSRGLNVDNACKRLMAANLSSAVGRHGDADGH